MPHPRLRQRPTPDAAALLKRGSLAQSNVQKKTVCFEELATWRQDNPAIVNGYRTDVEDWQACLSTIWWWHNETVNIWTHLLGAIFASFLAFCLVYSALADNNNNVAHSGYVGRPLTFILADTFPLLGWQDLIAFGVFIMGCLVCFSCSTIFHTSLCHREDVVRWTSRIDFLGILTLGTFNFLPTFHYGFYCDPLLKGVYTALMTLSGCVGIYLVCAPTYSSPHYRRMRAVTFVSLGLVAILPFAHAIMRYGFDEAKRSMALEWIAIEIIAYLLGVLL